MIIPDALRERAVDEGPAVDANELIFRMRERFTEATGAGFNYEVVLDRRSPDYLESHVAPRLALYLRSKRMHVSSCPSVFLSIFVGDRLIFVPASAFYEYIKVARGYSDDAFASLAKAWETTGRGALAALPSGEPPDA
ncbi:MAG: hypothetical protein JRH20_15470 [Deltaproteobacteria bacterium]|nr:hypothetical protein [Deltaproteobacteria bacterium]